MSTNNGTITSVRTIIDAETNLADIMLHFTGSRELVVFRVNEAYADIFKTGATIELDYIPADYPYSKQLSTVTVSGYKIKPV
jgi:hypothetical protein